MNEVAMPLEDREFNVRIRNQRMATGMSSEMTCAADCFARGYMVSKPLAGDSKYDLIVDRESGLVRVQVKTISTGNQIPIGLTRYSRDTYGKGVQEIQIPKYDGTEFDILAAVDRDTKDVYYIPVHHIDFKRANIPFGKTMRAQYTIF